MIKRKFWLKAIENAWRGRTILWLSGVRRVGKTILSKSLANVDYFDCELPSVRRTISDPEAFLKKEDGKRIVLDEIHRLSNPSELLKIAADHFPKIRILATGSSSLNASRKFKDTLTGRKSELWLTPMIGDDLRDFGKFNLKHRLLFGGLPPLFLNRKLPEQYFQEWIDAYWARDIQELFRLERRHSFQKFLELLMLQSGGIFEANKFSVPCEVSRTTIASYLNVLEETYTAHIIRPYSSRRKTEIVAAPKVYMFDTGFVCYFQGINTLKQKDMGQLWEHYVLNELQAKLQTRKICYWRDKRGHEVDFVITRQDRNPIVIEAKWSSKDFDPVNVKMFKRLYPLAKIFVTAADITNSFEQNIAGLSITFSPLSDLANHLSHTIQ